MAQSQPAVCEHAAQDLVHPQPDLEHTLWIHEQCGHQVKRQYVAQCGWVAREVVVASMQEAI